MLNVTVHVLSSGNPTTLTHPSQNDVYIGLVLQYHFVVLDKIPFPNESSDAASCDNLDDATIEEGDQHTRQITRGPRGSMLTIENPEADAQVFTVAPAEGQRPLDIMTDATFEAMCNPDKFCFGTGTDSSARPRNLTQRKYFNQRLLDVDGRFAKDLEYLFVAQYIVERKQIQDDGNNFVWRQKPFGRFTVGQAKEGPGYPESFCKKGRSLPFHEKH